MPFPLAHPAAVLPLRRYCPQRLNFPALVIGSLCPDLGYCFGPLHLDKFSHRFLAGSFGFCLPVGLVLVLLFYLVRRRVVRRLPARQRRIFEPSCLRPPGPILIIVLSLLLGAWTHIFLDSVTHEHGLFVTHLPVLEANIIVANHQFQLCDLLYAVCTFAGVIYGAMVYLNWFERAAGGPLWIFPGFKWVAAGLAAALALLISFANHDVGSTLDLADIGLLTVALVAAFLAAASWGLRDSGGRAAESSQAKTSAPRAASILPANSATVGESNKSCNGNSI